MIVIIDKELIELNTSLPYIPRISLDCTFVQVWKTLVLKFL
jgi:hypothetical protein